MSSLPAEVLECLAAYARSEKPARDVERAAVKLVVARLAAAAPGKSVEFRVPPYSAIQLVEGPAHRRGTPPALVEMSAQTLLEVASGTSTWAELRTAGRIIASGERSDLHYLFPCFTLQD